MALGCRAASFLRATRKLTHCIFPLDILLRSGILRVGYFCGISVNSPVRIIELLSFLNHSAPITPLESALTEVLIPGNLKLFGMNTYKKTWGRGVLLLTTHPTRMLILPAPSLSGSERSESPASSYNKLSGSISTSTAVCGISLASQYAMAPLSIFVSTDRFRDFSRN
jgi:hypothetical protein